MIMYAFKQKWFQLNVVLQVDTFPLNINELKLCCRQIQKVKMLLLQQLGWEAKKKHPLSNYIEL